MTEGENKSFAFIKDQPDGTKLIDYSDMPLEIDGAEVSSLKMREPRVSDELSVDHIESPVKREVAIITNLCELSPNVITNLTIRQYGRLQDAYRVFLT